MKKILINSLLILAVAFSSASVDAAWRCKMSNARGQTWNGYGRTRAMASANAMSSCSRYSALARNCEMNWCRPGY